MSNERNDSLVEKLANTPTGRRSFLRNTGIAALMAAGAMGLPGGTAAAQSKETTTVYEETSEIPEGARLTLRLMRSLTLYNMGFLSSSANDRAAIKEIALKQISAQFSQLGSIDGSWVGYTPNPEDDDPWPWPWWWGRRKHMDFSDIIRWDQIPLDAQLTVKLFNALTVYNQSFLRKSGDEQRKLQSVALGQMKRLVGQLGSSGGGIAYWDGDICPDWWPWPWPGPRRAGDPDPQPNLRATLDLASSILDFNLGSAFADGGAWNDLQQTAFDQMNQQFGQLRSGMQAMRASGFAMYEPGDGICPDWWPWPWPGPRRITDMLDPDPHPWRIRGESFKINTGIFRSLTLIASASIFQDIQAGAALQELAINEVGTQLEQLGKQIG